LLGRPVGHVLAVGDVDEGHPQRRLPGGRGGQRRLGPHRLQQRQGDRDPEALEGGAAREQQVLLHFLSLLARRFWNGSLLTIWVTRAENLYFSLPRFLTISSTKQRSVRSTPRPRA